MKRQIEDESRDMFKHKSFKNYAKKRKSWNFEELDQMININRGFQIFKE